MLYIIRNLSQYCSFYSHYYFFRILFYVLSRQIFSLSHLSGWWICEINARLNSSLHQMEKVWDVIRRNCPGGRSGRKGPRTLMGIPGGSARICMVNGLFGRRGILWGYREQGKREGAVNGGGVQTETSSLLGNVPRAELIAPGYKRNPVGHCMSGSEPVRDQK